MMHETLSQLGVRPDLITSDEKAFLDANGYLPLGQILMPEQLEAIRNRIRMLLEEEGEKAGAELLDSPHIRHPKEAGADRLADLVNKDPLFDLFYTHPRVLAAVACVLGEELKLSSLNYRAAKPGMGIQKLHVDWHEPVEPGNYQVCNSIWLLDDFSAANGATRLVAGTHLSGKLPQDVMEDPLAPHPNEIVIEAQAGSVVVFNSHTWHGGTDNHSDKPRRAVHSYFCRRDQPQQVDQLRYIRPETRARLSQAAQTILAV
jgi:ectoine hydroxylase-related dioxygenase (phytanoyl-CoA dioxygenase family)